MMSDQRYIIGIDLGTTNCAVSYVDLSEEEGARAHIEMFPVPQLTGPGEISELKLLPSFLYMPGEHEISRDALNLPWPTDGGPLVGAFARDQGARVPGRLVSSTKSWLCHGRVDRRSPILPWGAGEEQPQLSPVAATAAYLKHIKDAWNYTRARDEDEFLERQRVVITVPASFDEVARDLTLEAARQAGIKRPTLLEEPLAAFYTWLFMNEGAWNELIRPGALVLVCDVGGGTTDFTLIALRDKEGKPALERIAVGDHLILGGDNMDLALARGLELKLRKDQKTSLRIQLWQSLCHQCRRAKEEILGGGKETQTVTLVGEGRRLIAGTVSAPLERREVEEVILEGFYPFVEPGEDLAEKPRKGMTEFGLPYAQDPAVTRQLIRFLALQKEHVAGLLQRDDARPDLILFNGGSLKPAAVQDRLRSVIRKWFGETDQSLPGVLDNSDLDLAVARGASYYGLVRRGRGIRVSSGSARAYYLGVGRADSQGAGEDTSEKAICLVERGMEEDRRIRLENKGFQVLTNQPVGFDLYSSSFRTGDRVGDILTVDDSMTALPPIRTVIQFGKKAGKKSLPIDVEAHYTEVGTLSLWCRSLQTDHRWRLQFQLRDADQEAPFSDARIYEESLVTASLDILREAFSNKDKSPPGGLVKSIHALVRHPKEKWPLSFIRRMADTLIQMNTARRISADHEARWLNLVGFCLRPGFGDALDEHRVQTMWKMYHEGPVHGKAVQVRSEWWVFWRRVSAGLTANQQRRFLQETTVLIRPKKKTGKIRISPQEHLEIWMSLANLERVPASDKAEWGRFLLNSLTPKKSRPQYWWALSRFGAREPLYGPLDKVIPPKEVSRWIDDVLKNDWKNLKPIAMALAQMARRTGDRARDLDSALIERVLEWMSPFEWAGPYRKHLESVFPMDTGEENMIFGESLPSGIVLRTED